MAINFPNSPSLNELYIYNDTTWQWSGEYWNVYSAQTGYITSVSNAGNGFPVIQSVTSNALTLKSFSGTNLTITDSGGQLNFYVPLNGGGGGQLYYFNISKTQTPYLELATSATTGTEQSITSAATSGNTVTIGQFLTLSGYPGVSIIPGGVWSFYLHSYKQNSSASFDIYCDVYKRTTGGTQTLLFSTDPSPVLSNSPTPIMVLTDTYYSGTTLDTSDRILVNVRATNTSNNTYSITFVSEGSQHYSYVSSPLLLKTTDIYVDSFTYTPSANTITIGQTESYPPQEITINSFSGLTINGNLTVTGTTSTGTISATTYFNLPTYISAVTESENVITVTSNGGSPSTYTIDAVTGGTYSNGVITLSGTGNVNGTQITGLGDLTPTTLYSGNGSLSGNRTVTIGTNSLSFSSSTDANLLNISGSSVGVGVAASTNYRAYISTVGSALKVEGTFGIPLTVVGGSASGTIASFISSGTSEKMRLTYDGKLGIGTISPSTTLHVSASTDPVRFVGLQGASDTSVLTVDGTGVVHTIAASSLGGGGLTWNNATTAQTAAVSNGYVGTATTLTTITLPTGATFGSIIEVVGTGTGLWRISQNAGQSIKFGVATTATGAGGYLSATSQYDCVKLLCTSADTTFVVTSAIGNIFYI